MGQKTHKDGGVLMDIINIIDERTIHMVDIIEAQSNRLLSSLNAYFEEQARYEQYLKDCTFFKEATDLGVKNSGDVWD